MHHAMKLAKKGLGKTSPNPCVGAVIVRGQRVLGQGWHRQAGGAHAEVLAVQDALDNGHAKKLKSSSFYVTLEPCSTHGKTPPCVDLIIKHGFKRVVIAATDPNPQHAGRAYQLLSQHGIEVTHGVLEEQATFLNRSFNYWITHRQPWVVVKVAMTLDGHMTLPKGEGQWITGEKALRDVQRERSYSDAILVGAETLRKDNPRLTVRRGEQELSRQPWRVVITRTHNLEKRFRRKHLFADRWKDKTLVYHNKRWSSVMKDLGQRGVNRLMVEGGGNVIQQLVRLQRIHEVILYYAPKIVDPIHPSQKRNLVRADSLRKLKLRNMQLTHLGDDLKLWGLI